MRAYSRPSVTVLGSMHELTQADFAKGVGSADAINVSAGPVGDQGNVPGSNGYVNGHVYFLSGGYIVGAS